jgi:hypothetical protein
MKVIEDVTFEEAPNQIRRLNIPLTRHVRIEIHDLEELTEQQPTEKKLKFSETPLCGMWADRKDMEDPSAYVRKLREPRYKDAY